jgi:hypothetical protein
VSPLLLCTHCLPLPFLLLLAVHPRPSPAFCCLLPRLHGPCLCPCVISSFCRSRHCPSCPVLGGCCLCGSRGPLFTIVAAASSVSWSASLLVLASSSSCSSAVGVGLVIVPASCPWLSSCCCCASTGPCFHPASSCSQQQLGGAVVVVVVCLSRPVVTVVVIPHGCRPRCRLLAPAIHPASSRSQVWWRVFCRSSSRLCCCP